MTEARRPVCKANHGYKDLFAQWAAAKITQMCEFTPMVLAAIASPKESDPSMLEIFN
jgi:hypothetical protein